MASKVVRPVLLGTGLAADSRLKEVEENYERKLRQANREKEEMEAQVESAREKWKMAERREKELQTALKDTRDQSEKRRVKISDLEGKLAEN
jgi:predicted  nucleic acid-binding Zn-ribbon protein